MLVSQEVGTNSSGSRGLKGPQTKSHRELLAWWWLGHPTRSPVCSAQEWGTLRVHRKWVLQCEP